MTFKEHVAYTGILCLLGVWIGVLTVQVSLLKTEQQLMQTTHIGKQINPHTLSLAKKVESSTYPEIQRLYGLPDPGAGGEVLVVRLFGGTYLYIAMNQQQEVVDYVWHKT